MGKDDAIECRLRFPVWRAPEYERMTWERCRLAERERDAAIARVAELEAERDLSGACPCNYVTPCHAGCTCVNPLSSSGCRRCCAYGSVEQRKAMAEMLTADAADLLRWRPVIEAAQAWRDADMHRPQEWRTYDAMRDAIDAARAKEGK